MTRERLQELKRLHEAAFANEGGHGISDAPQHKFREAMLAALPRLLLERERAVKALHNLRSGHTDRDAHCEACPRLLDDALAFVEEEA